MNLNTDRDGFYKHAFFLLATFVLGNGVSFLIFGVHTASKSDLDTFSEAQNVQIAALKTEVQLLDDRVTDLAAQLRVQKLIIP